jgi:hypothetical protein
MTTYGNPERLLIVAKTYPGPSTSYIETTCVVALTDKGEPRRLYPVPFRLLTNERQFRKWEWITARVALRDRDRRPESRRIDADSIKCIGIIVGPDDLWARRKEIIAPHVVSSQAELERRQSVSGQSLGVVHVSRLIAMEIEKRRDTQWTDRELMLLQRRGLWDPPEAHSRPLLEKIPYTFRYHYEIDTDNGPERSCHPITDWEISQLFRRCARKHADNWEAKFRERAESYMQGQDLYLLLGNMHRQPHQWLIVSVIYPPKQSGCGPTQLAMPP